MIYETTIADRTYTYGEPLNTLLAFDTHKNYYFPLPHMGVLHINGEQAAALLQGQFSCDIRAISAASMRTGGLYNLKGRLLALPDIIQSDHGWYLVEARDMQALTQKTLQPYARLSRCLIQARDLSVTGFYIQNAATRPDWLTLPEEPQSVLYTDWGIIWCIAPSLYTAILHTPEAMARCETSEDLQHKAAIAWHYLRLQHGLFDLYPKTSGCFLPHRLNLHTGNSISFTKGCYKGQEIIARVHYKSTHKHTLQCFEYPALPALIPGDPLINPSTQQPGELVDYTPTTKTDVLWVAASCIK